MNSLVKWYRQQAPNDTLSDEQITLIYGDDYPGQLDKQFPDFAADYAALNERRKRDLAPPISSELGRGFARGVDSLQSTGYGALALFSDFLPESIGAAPREFYAQKAKEQGEEAALNQATIPSYKDIHSFSDAARYGLGGLGEVTPSIAEAIVTGLAGAAAGSTAGPAGIATGGVGGFLFRNSARQLVKKGVEKLAVKDATEAALKEAAGEIAEFAAGRSIPLGELSKRLLVEQAKANTRNIGAAAATGLNSLALSSGEIYNDLKDTPGMDPADAKWIALTGGIVAAAPDTVLPYYLVSKFFPGLKTVSKEARKDAGNYLLRFAKTFGKEALKTTPLEAGTEAFQEVVNAAAVNYANPATREKIFEFTPEQKERFVNAGILGGIGGFAASSLAAIAEHRNVPVEKVKQVQEEREKAAAKIAATVEHPAARSKVSDAEGNTVSHDEIERMMSLSERIIIAIDEGRDVDQSMTQELQFLTRTPNLRNAYGIISDEVAKYVNAIGVESLAKVQDMPFGGTKQVVEAEQDDASASVDQYTGFLDQVLPPVAAPTTVATPAPTTKPTPISSPLVVEPTAPVAPPPPATPVAETKPDSQLTNDAIDVESSVTKPVVEQAAPAPPVVSKPFEQHSTVKPDDLFKLVDFEGAAEPGKQANVGTQAAPAFEATSDWSRVMADAKATGSKRKLVVLLAPDKSHVVVASVTTNNGPKVSMPNKSLGSKGRAVDYSKPVGGVAQETVAQAGYTPVGAIKLNADAKNFFVTYSPTEWQALEQSLSEQTAKVNSANEIAQQQQAVTNKAINQVFDPDGNPVEFLNRDADMPEGVAAETEIESLFNGLAKKQKIKNEGEARAVVAQMMKDTTHKEDFIAVVGRIFVQLTGQPEYDSANEMGRLNMALEQLSKELYGKYQAQAVQVATARNRAGKAGVQTAPVQAGATQATTVVQKGRGAAESEIKFSREPLDGPPFQKYGATPDEQNTFAIQVLAEELSKRGKLPPGVRLEAVQPADDKSGVGRAMAAAKQLGSFFGKRVVFYRQHGQSDGKFLSGVIDTALPEFVFVNLDTPRAHMAVVGHELLHHLRREAPELYERLVHSMVPVINRARFENEFWQKLKASGYEKGEALEELVANFMGDQMVDPDFWNQLATSNPSLFEQVSAVVSRWLDALVNFIKGRGFGSERYVHDINAARTALAEAVNNYATQRRSTELIRQGITPPGIADRLFTSADLSQIPAIYDPFTGEMKSDMVPDSTWAAAYNVQNNIDRQNFLREGGVNSPAPLGGENAHIEAMVDVAANNEVLDNLTAAFQAYNDSGANVDRLTFDKFLELMEVDNPKAQIETIKETLAKNGANPLPNENARGRDLRSADFKSKAAIKARIELNSIIGKMRRTFADNGDFIEKIDKKRDKRIERLGKIEQLYKDAEFIYADVLAAVSDFVTELKSDFTQKLNDARKLGALTQNIKALANLGEVPDAWVKLVDAAFDRIKKNPVKFTDALLEVAKLDLDWKNTPIRELRNQLSAVAGQIPAVRSVSQRNLDFINSDAMLSIVAAFAKRNDLMMARIELRQKNDAEAALAIQQSLDMAKSDYRDAAKEAVRLAKRVPRLGKIANRLLFKYQEMQRQNAQLATKRKALKAFNDAFAAIDPTLQTEGERLVTELGAHTPVELTSGVSLHVAPKPSSTVKEVQDSTFEFKRPREGQINDATHAKLFEVIKKNQAWLDANPVHGSMWNTLHDTNEKLKQEIAMDNHRTSRASIVLNWIGSLAQKALALGVDSATAAARRMNIYSALHKDVEIDATVQGTNWENARSAAMKALKIKDGTTFENLFYHTALSFFNRNKHLVESSPDPETDVLKLWDKKLRTDSTTRDYMEAHPEAWAALEKFYRQTATANQHFVSLIDRLGLTVKDSALGLYRKLIGSSLFNVARVIRKEIRVLRLEMLKAGWGPGTKETEVSPATSGHPTKHEVAEAFAADPEAAAPVLQKLFPRDIWNKFAGPIAGQEGRSLFSAARGDAKLVSGEMNPDGTPKPARIDGTFNGVADVEDVQKAYNEAGGDFVAFATKLHELSGAEVDLPVFIGETFDTFAGIFEQINGIENEREQHQLKFGNSAVNTVPHSLMDARIADNFPAQFLDYQRYDQTGSRVLANQLAIHAAFGRDMAGVNHDLDIAEQDIAYLDQKYRGIEERVTRDNPGTSGNALTKLVETEVRREAVKEGEDPDKYLGELKTAVKNLPNASRLKDQLEAWFTSQGGGLMEQRAALEAIHTMAAGVVQGPRTALMNTLSMSDPLARYPLSRGSLSQVKANWQAMMGNIAGSLMETIGIQTGINAENALRRKRIGRYDTDNMVKTRDQIRAIISQDIPGSTLERGIVKGARAIRAAMTASFPKLTPSENRLHPGLKPGALFTQFAQWMDASIIDGHFRTFDDLMLRAIEYVRDPRHAGEVSKPDFKFTSDMLGYKSGKVLDDAKFFTAIRDALDEYGMNLEKMAKERAGDDGPLYTDAEYGRIAQIAMDGITLNASLSNQPSWMQTNPVLHMAAPLLGWSVRRVGQLEQAIRKDPGTLAQLQAATKLFAAILPIGLAYAWLMDEYDEKITGKKSNIRQFTDDDFWLPAIERTARVGTFGVLGDVANTAVNYADSGDLRGISFDNRVLFMNSTLGMLRAIGALGRQETATYDTVYRPMIQSLGGAGYLQYAQIINNALGLDNAEARVTARLNAQNYLRTVGRELKLDVLSSRGAASLPTPIKPYVSEMALAAYANDASGFMDAYRDAIKAAAAEGKPDPAEYVRNSFRYRHPLRSVFKTPPTEGDYRNILNALPSDGRRDVAEAVRLFNYYGSTIGVKEFDGKEDKKPTANKVVRPSFTLNDFRQAALAR